MFCANSLFGTEKPDSKLSTRVGRSAATGECTIVSVSLAFSCDYGRLSLRSKRETHIQYGTSTAKKMFSSNESLLASVEQDCVSFDSVTLCDGGVFLAALLDRCGSNKLTFVGDGKAECSRDDACQDGNSAVREHRPPKRSAQVVEAEHRDGRENEQDERFV